MRVCACARVCLHQSGVEVDGSREFCGGWRGLTQSGHEAPQLREWCVLVCVHVCMCVYVDSVLIATIQHTAAPKAWHLNEANRDLEQMEYRQRR